ncbi:MAG: DUF2630 family protein [Chloroflexota bacterium]
MESETLERINQLVAERQELFRRAAVGDLPAAERPRLKALSEELGRLWDEHRRQGHPPAVPPVVDEWDKPKRRSRKAPTEAVVNHVQWPDGSHMAA